MNLFEMDSALLSNPQVKKEERRCVMTVKGGGAEEAALSSQ